MTLGIPITLTDILCSLDSNDSVSLLIKRRLNQRATHCLLNDIKIKLKVIYNHDNIVML